MQDFWKGGGGQFRSTRQKGVQLWGDHLTSVHMVTDCNSLMGREGALCVVNATLPLVGWLKRWRPINARVVLNIWSVQWRATCGRVQSDGDVLDRRGHSLNAN